jgi:hypothetical protein
MKKITILLLLLSMTSPMLGAVFTKVCEADGNTPFDGRDIMVGTKLTFITSSDTGGAWDMGGGLFIKEANGILSGRNYNDITMDWEGSRYPAAGVNARVWDWADGELGIGFMFGGASDAIAGDWFIIDYNASEVGNCTVDFYDFNVSDEPVDSFIFHHVRTRDFNNDTKVDFCDYAILASYWQTTGCNEPGGWCEGADLDTDGNVDYNDLMLFCEYWLERTE